jgi:hypothetical protein
MEMLERYNIIDPKTLKRGAAALPDYLDEQKWSAATLPDYLDEQKWKPSKVAVMGGQR